MDKDEKSGTMLLTLIASVAIASGIKPEEAAKHFAPNEKTALWLKDFTMAALKIGLEDAFADVKKKTKK